MGNEWACWALPGPRYPSKHERGRVHTSTGSQITGKANGEAATKWCFTQLGHKMARPCVKEGPAEPVMLRARHHSAAAGGHVPLPTQDLSAAWLYHTGLCPLAWQASGAHSLS